MVHLMSDVSIRCVCVLQENEWNTEVQIMLTEEEVADLVIFMKEGLKSAEYPHVDPPELP